MYSGVTGSLSTLSVPCVIVVESLVQVTVVAGPPVETQVIIRRSASNANPPNIETSPTRK